ncbi:glucuronyl esterase domain-containing protein [Sorangium sp. So ce363]|uniref:glucuronyl esterase domain-containing protein n=1 Tax=Sorangium sp. So ce363 TaxID=3133304 RepID=UPI003F627E8F
MPLGGMSAILALPPIRRDPRAAVIRRPGPARSPVTSRRSDARASKFHGNAESGALTAWVWSASRILDALETTPGPLPTIGHQRKRSDVEEGGARL